MSVLLPPNLQQAIRYREPLAHHTTWRVGGPADIFYIPSNQEDVSNFLTSVCHLPLAWLGLGSNVLVRDGGIRGAVVVTAGGLAELRLTESGLYVGAGVPLAKVARFCASHGLVGLEFFAGIPGTIGGALAMNAGAAGGETWTHIEYVQTVDRAGCIRRRNPSDFTIGYRSVIGPDEWFVGAHFTLNREMSVDGRHRIRELLARRNATQPVQTANAGSVFRNPPGQYAAVLIERCGLKGLREGAAVVSERHANFIVNEGGATAAAIETLILRVQTMVYERMGIRLEPEIRILGEAP